MSTPAQKAQATRRRRKLLASIPTRDKLRRLDRRVLLEEEDYWEAQRRSRKQMLRYGELDRQALEEGYPDAGYRPWKIRDLRQKALRAGDPEALAVLHRFVEVSQAIQEAQREQTELQQTLRVWEKEIDYIERRRRG